MKEAGGRGLGMGRGPFKDLHGRRGLARTFDWAFERWE